MSPLITALPPLSSLIAASIALLLVQIFIQAQSATVERGSAWTASPRDGFDGIVHGIFAGRARRALDNYKETLPAFLALAVCLIALGRTSGVGEIGAIVWLAARLVYLPLYYLGIPHVRSLVWLVSIGGLVTMIVGLF